MGDTLGGLIGEHLKGGVGNRRDLYGPIVIAAYSAGSNLLLNQYHKKEGGTNLHRTFDTSRSRFICLRASSLNIYASCTCGDRGGRKIGEDYFQRPSVVIRTHSLHDTGCIFKMKDMEKGWRFDAQYHIVLGSKGFHEELSQIVKESDESYSFKAPSEICGIVRRRQLSDATTMTSMMIERELLDAQDNMWYRIIKDKIDRKRSQSAQNRSPHSWGSLSGTTNVDHIIEIQVVAEALADYMYSHFTFTEIRDMIETQAFDDVVTFIAQNPSNLCRISRELNADKALVCRVHTCRDHVTTTNFGVDTIREYFNTQWDTIIPDFLTGLETLVMRLGPNSSRWDGFINILGDSVGYYMFSREVNRKQK